MTGADVDRLMDFPGIVRNRRKIESAISLSLIHIFTIAEEAITVGKLYHGQDSISLRLTERYGLPP